VTSIILAARREPPLRRFPHSEASLKNHSAATVILQLKSKCSILDRCVIRVKARALPNQYSLSHGNARIPDLRKPEIEKGVPPRGRCDYPGSKNETPDVQERRGNQEVGQTEANRTTRLRDPNTNRA
jgi:hypothetical protein